MQTEADIQDRCLLEHAAFTAIGGVTFRRAGTDGTPVMIVPLGERDASVPLRSLQREFGIADDSPDGRMLGLIAESLDYVTGLRLGDRLPSEVLTGQASWEPGPQHRKLAANRLRMQLVRWLDPAMGEPDHQTLVRIDESREMRQQVQAAFARAAAALGLESPADVVLLMEALAEELSYIEALRDLLFRRVKALGARAEQLGQDWRGDGSRQEALTQMRRLLDIAIRQLGRRFEEVDSQTGDVLQALRNAEAQHAFIRSNRDWLYRCLLAWQPVLNEWTYASFQLDDAMWALIGRTYQFLAPRYMPVTEWQVFSAQRQTRAAAPRMMAW